MFRLGSVPVSIRWLTKDNRAMTHSTVSDWNFLGD